MTLKMNKNTIVKTKIEKNLGMIVSADLKRTDHVDRMVMKANMILDMLKRTFLSRDLRLW